MNAQDIQDIFTRDVIRDVERVREILREHPESVNEQYIFGGGNPLYHACWRGTLDCIEALLDAGADINCNKAGQPPLHQAIRRGRHEGRLEVVNVLVAAGADVSKPGFNGATALHVACSLAKPCPQTIQIMLDAGADVNAWSSRRDGFKTPLHEVLEQPGCSQEVFERLLAAGADPNLKNSKGYTPLGAAKNMGYVDLVARFQACARRQAAERDINQTHEVAPCPGGV